MVFAAVLPFVECVGNVQTGMGIVDSIISFAVAIISSKWLAAGIVVALASAVYGPNIVHRIKVVWSPETQQPFSVRPIPGDTLPWSHDPELLTGKTVMAQLAIANTSGKPLQRCSVRLVEACPLVQGQVLSGPNWHPSVSRDRGEGFLLAWAESEEATPDKKYLDIAPDGAEHVANILLLMVPKGIAIFAAARAGDLDGKLSGVGNDWCKLRIKIAAADGTYLNTEWAAICSDRDPGPIQLRDWKQCGKAILASQRP